MNTITRRTALAGAAALPLLPGAALAASATLPASALAQPADPAVAAYRAWRAAFDAWERSMDHPDLPDDDPAMLAAMRAEWQAKVDLASMVATTPEGLAGQIRMGLGIFGELEGSGADFDNPADHVFGNWRDDVDGRLYRNMLAGAEGMAKA